MKTALLVIEIIILLLIGITMNIRMTALEVAYNSNPVTRQVVVNQLDCPVTNGGVFVVNEKEKVCQDE